MALQHLEKASIACLGAITVLLAGCTRKEGPCEVIQARPLLRYHRAAEGEALADIAKHYGMSVQELCRLNNFTEAFALVPGQKVFVIPPKDGELIKNSSPSITVETSPSGFGEIIEGNIENGEQPLAPFEEDDSLSISPKEEQADKEEVFVPVKTRFIWPVHGSLLRRFKEKLPNGTLSDGINISAPANTPVRAIANGVVVDVGELVLGFGKMVLLLHNDGMVSIYSHLQEIAVRKETNVQQGQVIGRVGKTGNVRIPQLHFQLRNTMKAPIDPLKFLPSAEKSSHHSSK